MSAAPHAEHTDPQPGSGSRKDWVKGKLRQFWPVIPLAAILFALMLSDLNVMGYSPIGSDPCALNEVDQSGFSTKLYAPLAQRALKVNPSGATNVSIVTVDANTEPPGLLTNACDSRDFLARLVGDLNTLGARVITIDKYFSPEYCADAEKTDAFISGLNASKVPVVVGQPTQLLSNTSNGCLALSPRLEFNTDLKDPKKPSKVRYGLNRLNSDTLKIPLRWPVFNEAVSPERTAIQPAISLGEPAGPPPTAVADPTQGNGLALMAAESYAPSLTTAPKIEKLLTVGIHPYTTFLNLPSVNAMTALCNAEPSHKYGQAAKPGGTDLCDPWVVTGDQLNQLKSMIQGKVIVIGDLSEQDMHPFPGGDQPGVFLQANYVQAILDQRFLEEIPLWLTLACLILFVIGVYCLYWSHDVHGQPHLTPERAGIGSLIVLLAMAGVSILVLLKYQYFTPVWAIWGAGVFMIFRYLEASGHHRSQHLLGQLSGAHHTEPTSNGHEKKETK